MKKGAQISLRQYAKERGTSHVTVKKAIDRGDIVDGYDIKTGMINPVAADLEWGADFMRNKAEKQMAKNAKKSIEEDEDDVDLLLNDADIPQGTSYKELCRLELLYKSRLAKLRLEKESGFLVLKEDVYRQLFSFGQSLRQKLELLPERVIDELLSLNRDEAKNLLVVEIHKILDLSIKYEDDFNTGND